MDPAELDPEVKTLSNLRHLRIKAEDVVKEIKAEDAVIELKAEDAVKELKAEDAVIELKEEDVVKDIKAMYIVKGRHYEKMQVSFGSSVQKEIANRISSKIKTRTETKRGNHYEVKKRGKK